MDTVDIHPVPTLLRVKKKWIHDISDLSSDLLIKYENIIGLIDNFQFYNCFFKDRHRL